MNRKVFVLLLFCFSFTLGVSQEKFILQIEAEVDVQWDYKKMHSDTLSLINELKSFHSNLKCEGYLSSYVENSSIEGRKYIFKFLIGDRFSWEKLRVSSEIKQLLGRDIAFRSVYLNSKFIKKEIEEVLVKCQNNGYPFAQVKFDSVSINNGKVNAQLGLRLHDFVVIDSVVIKGGLKTAKNYVEKQIGITKGNVYNESKINGINESIRNVSFIKLIRSSEVFFTKGKATLVLYLKDQSASRFDGIIGLNPDEVKGKIGVVGDLKVNLLNSFKRGERIILNWEQAKSNSQEYLISFDYPFLFKSNIGILSSLNYYRQDTSFANLNAEGGLSYFLDENQKAGVSIQVVESNSLLNVEDNSLNFPEINSVSTIYYGVNYNFNSLDYRVNPRKGWQVLADLKTGKKKVKKNPNYGNEDYSSLEESSTQIKANLSLSYFIPLFKKNTLLLRVMSGNIFGDNIFVNELYQLGGLNSIRGFNQQSILASNYYLGTVEFRYLFDRNSSVFGFLDYGFYENKSVNTYQKDTPIGFGVGTNFQTKAGIFTISYGLGRQKGNPILVKNGKVHFGFVSLF